VSETIEVRAIIDRFLEHGRVFYFSNGGKDETYIGSADWMPRNFHRRVEAMIPVEDPALRARLLDILELQLEDHVKAWSLRPDGKYERVTPKPGAPPLRSQSKFIEMTRDRVKAAEAAATSGRFSLSTLSRPKVDTHLTEGRKRRREPAQQKKAP
jgi:polyphosphate kinase